MQTYTCILIQFHGEESLNSLYKDILLGARSLHFDGLLQDYGIFIANNSRG